MPEIPNMEKNDSTPYRVAQIQIDFAEMKSKIDGVYTALMGSEISKDGGLVGRIINGEEKTEKLDTRVTELEKKDDKRTLYLSIIIGIISALSGWVISAFISHLINAK